MPPSSTLRSYVLAAVIGGAALAGGIYVGVSAGRAPIEAVPGMLWPDPRALGDFSLRDHHGRPFDLPRLKGKWTLMFFGYTHCPDVCPTTLAVLDEVDRSLRERGPAPDVQYAFVTVDPERDTADRLGAYVTHFNARFLGVSGSDEETRSLTRQLGVLALKGDPDERGNYLVDHTVSIVLTDPQARFIALFGTPHEGRDIAERIAKIRAIVRG